MLLAVTKAIRPYQDKLIQCEMEKMFTAGINYTDRKTCNVIYGVVTLPNEPTVTGLVGRNAIPNAKDVDFDGDKVWEYFHMNN